MHILLITDSGITYQEFVYRNFQIWQFRI